MAHADIFPINAAETIARQIGERLASVAPRQALNAAPGAGPELGETLSVWTLNPMEAAKSANIDADLPCIAVQTGRWHHQVRYGGQAQAFARSINEPGMGVAEWKVTQLFASHIAERIDEAIEWVDQNVASDPLVRLVILPAFHVHAFWLAEEGKNQFLAVDKPETLTCLEYKTLYSAQDFVQRLSHEPLAQGVPPQRPEAIPAPLISTRTNQEARRRANNIVNGWVASAAITGFMPGSAVLLIAGEAVMIRQVADAFGIAVFDESVIRTYLNGVLGSRIIGMPARELDGWVPILGWLVKTSGLVSTAHLVGEAVIEYFAERSPLPDEQPTVGEKHETFTDES